MSIRTAMSVNQLRADGTQASQRHAMQFLLDHFRRFPLHRCDGCVPSNGTDATNDINFTAGCIVSSNGFVIPVDATAKQLDVAFALGGTSASPKGGLPAALTVSNTSYHAHALLNPETGLSTVGFDTSTSAATLLADPVARNAGLTEYGRIFSFFRSGGANVVFDANEIAGGGLRVMYRADVRDLNAFATNATRNTLALTVPLGVQLLAHIFLRLNLNAAGAGTGLEAWARSTTFTDAAPSSGSGPADVSVVAAVLGIAILGVAPTDVITTTAALIAHRQSNKSGDVGFTTATLNINTKGFTDFRVS